MKEYLIGADIGGTTVKLGIFKTDGTLICKWEIPTRLEKDGAYIIEDIAGSCRAHIKDLEISMDRVAGIGAGIPGCVNRDGYVDVCVNLGWHKVQAREMLEAALGLPAVADNDANAAALGEMWQGGARGADNLVMVTLGTGVGGGIILGGRSVKGAHGYGGEIGHMIINPRETDYCNCGKRGCVEQYCSATGIVRMTQRALSSYEGDTSLAGLCPLTAKDVFDAARAGDSFALGQVSDFAERLARGLSFISCVTDPEIFVIGGGVSGAGEILLEAVAQRFKDFTYGAQHHTRFALAQLGNDAGIYGCAKLVLDTIKG